MNKAVSRQWLSRGCTAALIGCFATATAAQTCQNPLTINPNVSNFGNTCTAPNSLPAYGASASPHREVVYRFTQSWYSWTGSITLWSESPPFAPHAVVLRSQCSSSQDPIAFGAAIPPASGHIDTSLLPFGTYYLVVTTDPSEIDYNHCGQYGLFAAPLTWW